MCAVAGVCAELACSARAHVAHVQAFNAAVPLRGASEDADTARGSGDSPDNSGMPHAAAVTGGAHASMTFMHMAAARGRPNAVSNSAVHLQGQLARNLLQRKPAKSPNPPPPVAASPTVKRPPPSSPPPRLKSPPPAAGQPGKKRPPPPFPPPAAITPTLTPGRKPAAKPPRPPPQAAGSKAPPPPVSSPPPPAGAGRP